MGLPWIWFSLQSCWIGMTFSNRTDWCSHCLRKTGRHLIALDDTPCGWSLRLALQYWAASGSPFGMLGSYAPGSTSWCTSRLRRGNFLHRDSHSGSWCCSCGSSWIACVLRLHSLSWAFRHVGTRFSCLGLCMAHILFEHYSSASTAW